MFWYRNKIILLIVRLGQLQDPSDEEEREEEARRKRKRTKKKLKSYS